MTSWVHTETATSSQIDYLNNEYKKRSIEEIHTHVSYVMQTICLNYVTARGSL